MSGTPWLVSIEQSGGAGRANRRFVLLDLAEFLQLSGSGGEQS